MHEQTETSADDTLYCLEDVWEEEALRNAIVYHDVGGAAGSFECGGSSDQWSPCTAPIASKRKGVIISALLISLSELIASLSSCQKCKGDMHESVLVVHHCRKLSEL